MADKQGHDGLCKNSAAFLDSKISQTSYEIRELEVINHELSCLLPKSKVHTRQGAGNLFFLSDRRRVVSEFKRKLDDTRTEHAQLNKQKQEFIKSAR